MKARPLRAPDGGVPLAINVIEDITELKQAEEAQRLLAEAGRVLAGSLDYEGTLRRVAWLAVPGDRGLVHGRPASATAGSSASRSRTPTPRTLAFAEELRGAIRSTPAAPVGPATRAAHRARGAAPRRSPSALLERRAVDPDASRG